MQVTFEDVASAKIRESFREVLARYPALHPYPITLRQQVIRGSTMQAQPIITPKSLWNGVKRYRINLAVHVRDSTSLRIGELPKEVIKGWFAHALGHVMDYMPRSNWAMVRYGINYLRSSRFRRQAEHQADYLAIAHGFHEEILATKRFILTHDLLDEAYKAKIRKYYLSIEEVELCVDGKMPFPPDFQFPNTDT